VSGGDAIRKRKDVVAEFFRHVSQGRPKESLNLFAMDCKQHNPYVAGDIVDLMESMSSAYEKGASEHKDADFSVRYILAEGDLVAAYTQFLEAKGRPAQGGLRQVHLFRFDADGKIAEYWDITQQILTSQPNAGEAF
jgi:predicted SnoaL-like aldol condensation-catalyzing enzyme